DEELAVEPCLGAFVVVLGQMPQLGDLLEALENKLDLPANSIPLHHDAGRELFFGKRGEDDDVLGVHKRLGPEFLSVLAFAPPELAVGLADGFFALSNHAYSSGN